MSSYEIEECRKMNAVLAKEMTSLKGDIEYLHKERNAQERAIVILITCHPKRKLLEEYLALEKDRSDLPVRFQSHKIFTVRGQELLTELHKPEKNFLPLG